MSENVPAAVTVSGELVPLSEWMDHCRNVSPRPVPACEIPDVSIVIPVYNKWELTRVCLNSLLETLDDGISCEVILADDASSDATLEAADIFPGLRVVRLGSNSGYIAACNAGAGQARGSYIVFLNNDTILCPGWLAALKSALVQRPDAAMAGAKLLFEDGRIQDAGGIIWKDGSCDRYGQDQPFDAGHLKYTREVDYACGACLMVRREFWEQAGGYDVRYGKGYFEDTDLAMSARAAGLCVLMVADALVVHKEHASMGSHAEAAIEHNREIFAEKWREQLDMFHLPPPPESAYHQGMAHACRRPTPEGVARRASGKLNILYYSPWPTHPVQHGNQSSMVNFGDYFREQGHTVHFAVLSNMVSSEQVSLMREFWDSVDLLANTNTFPEAEDPEQGIPWDAWYDEGLGEQVLALCLKYDIDMVFCSYIFQSKILEFVPAHILKVIDTHDKMGNRFAMLEAHGVPLHFFSTYPETEGKMLRRADLVVARREEEQNYFNYYIGKKTTITIPHSNTPAFLDKKYDKLTSVGIVASENYINCMLILDFLKAVQSVLDGAPCPFVINIAGNVARYYDKVTPEQRALFDLPYVNLLGFVADIGKFYAEQSIIAVPVTLGTGINTKTVQAFSYGVPVISTICGSKGTTSEEPYHYFPDDDLRQLVRGLLELCGHPEELQRLADVSRHIFLNYRNMLLTGMQQLFAHPKLHNAPAASTGHAPSA